MSIAVSFAPRLRDDPALLGAVTLLVRDAIAVGELPGRRGLPDGDEAVAWIGPNDAPYGFATFYDGGHNRVWLDILYIPAGHRRKGYARALLAAVEHEALESGRFDEIVFGTHVDNAAMQGAARGLGYVTIYVDMVKRLHATLPSPAPEA